MVETNVPLPLLPAHIEETIRSIARLHAEHHQNAQRAVDRLLRKHGGSSKALPALIPAAPDRPRP
jgi:hypothetical protein